MLLVAAWLSRLEWSFIFVFWRSCRIYSLTFCLSFLKLLRSLVRHDIWLLVTGFGIFLLLLCRVLVRNVWWWLLLLVVLLSIFVVFSCTFLFLSILILLASIFSARTTLYRILNESTWQTSHCLHTRRVRLSSLGQAFCGCHTRLRTLTSSFIRCFLEL